MLFDKSKTVPRVTAAYGTNKNHDKNEIHGILVEKLYQFLDGHFGKLKKTQVDFVAFEFVLNGRFLDGLHDNVSSTIAALKLLNESIQIIVIGKRSFA